MSKISEIFDAFDTSLSTLFSATHKELSDPYNLDGNTNKYLRRGYGFYMAPGFNTERLTGCQLSISRNLVVSLTVQRKGTDRDCDIRKTAEKQILEDQYNLIKNIEQDVTLNGKVAKIAFSSDGGLEFVFAEKQDYLAIVSSFEFEYFEDLT